MSALFLIDDWDLHVDYSAAPCCWVARGMGMHLAGKLDDRWHEAAGRFEVFGEFSRGDGQLDVSIELARKFLALQHDVEPKHVKLDDVFALLAALACRLVARQGLPPLPEKP